MLFKDLERIVFAGDSVTDMGSQIPVGEGLFENVGSGKSYVRAIENLLYACYPEVRVRVTNSGVSGNTSRDLLARFERDVIGLNPDYISICIGINDVWRQFDCPAMPEYAVTPEDYEANMRKMIEMATAKAKKTFIMTPFIMEKLREDEMRARMDVYSDICRKLAAEYGCVLVDIQAAFDEYFRHRHSAFIAWDRIHPNYIGATVIAREFLSKCEFDYGHAAE